MQSRLTRPAPLLTSIVVQLDILNDAQAESIGHLEQIREGIHTINNKMAVLATNSEVDAQEITKVLKTVDNIEALLKRYFGAVASEAGSESNTRFIEVEGPTTARDKRRG